MIQLRTEQEHGAGLVDLAPDLTPMLDILFILLVFFMLTAGTVLQSFEVTLPEDVTDEMPTLKVSKPIIIEIKKDVYIVDKKQINEFKNLKISVLELVKRNPDQELVIAGDKDVSIDRLLGLLTYLQTQNIKTANILMTRGTGQ
ncbi:ExbD/TolR family protein [Sneathiella aquimaris]|uniref:ExbD/TolR family protein n=1 Tax=Sneathiella aquimaris TaxID=2599305 RepID=UPI00146F241F|nr:biopolymer transporter ExbD [Sneathiella aquimaris]